MGKLLQLLSFIFLGILVIGTTFMKQNPVFWLATSTNSYQYIREILLAILTVQIVTRPPRHIVFRILSAGLALGVGIWALAATNSYDMRLLDTIGFVGAACAIGVTALEYSKSEPRVPSTKTAAVA